MATEKQIKRLLDASENLAAYFAADACRIIREADDDANLAPYLEKLPVKVVREFDEAICSIQESKMDSFEDEQTQLQKYDAAMKDMIQ